jgi:hypothetical protein
MQQSEIGGVMLSATSQTLETMFFTGVESELEPAEAKSELGPDAWSVEVGFNGNPSGAFWLELPETTARALADSFLGAFGDEVPNEKVREVAFELANMLCGSVLSHFGGDCTFLLEPPRWAKPEACTVARYVRAPEGVLGILLRLQVVEEQAVR